MRTTDYPFEFMNFEGLEERFPWLVILDYLIPRTGGQMSNIHRFQTALHVKVHQYGRDGEDYDLCFAISQYKTFVIFKRKMDAIHFKLTWRAPDLL